MTQPPADLDVLKLAFGYHFARLVVETDGAVGEEEHQFLDTLFWREKLIQAGLITHSGEITEALPATVRRAVQELATHATLADRLDLLTLILRATLSDGAFQWGEGTVVNRAAQLLGLTPAEVDAHFAQLGDLVGEVDLPEAEPGEGGPQ